MTEDQFASMWELWFALGLVMCFGLGAIFGGQR